MADDEELQTVKGIGPFIAEKLEEVGVVTLEDLANITTAQEAEINEKLKHFPGRSGRDDWAGQALAMLKADAKKAQAEAKKSQKTAGKSMKAGSKAKTTGGKIASAKISGSGKRFGAILTPSVMEGIGAPSGKSLGASKSSTSGKKKGSKTIGSQTSAKKEKKSKTIGSQSSAKKEKKSKAIGSQKSAKKEKKSKTIGSSAGKKSKGKAATKGIGPAAKASKGKSKGPRTLGPTAKGGKGGKPQRRLLGGKK